MTDHLRHTAHIEAEADRLVATLAERGLNPPAQRQHVIDAVVRIDEWPQPAVVRAVLRRFGYVVSTSTAKRGVRKARARLGYPVH